MELSHLLKLVSELPENTTLNYVRGTDTCTYVNVDIDGERINSLDPNGDNKSWAPSYLQDLAPKIHENVPFNLSGLLNNKGSFRPVLETIIAHTREFYTVRKGTAIALVWIPSKPKNALELTEISESDIPVPKPVPDTSLLSKEELVDKVRSSFIKFWDTIDQHGAQKDLYIEKYESFMNDALKDLNLPYDNIFEIIDLSQFLDVVDMIAKSSENRLFLIGGSLPQGNNGYIWSTNRHYKNFLKILSITDFRANLDNQKNNRAEIASKRRKQPLQQIFYGAPGTGKSFTIDDMADDDHSVRTTFHPDSDYASFVGAYKPTMEDMPLSAFVGKEVHLAQPQGGHTGTERKIVYKYVPQAFLKAYVAAWKDLDNDYYLVIEEINRGNCAQIFGDLFQLLDRNSMGCSSYAIHADDDIRQFLSTDKNGFADLTEEQAQAIREFVLEKDNGKTQAVGQDILDGNLLLLPPRLHIWATMNTSDQSLFPIDSAFKRRWDWKYMPIDYKPTDKKSGHPIDWKFRIGDNLYSWGQFLGKINPEIYTLTESSDKQMGYFFAKADRSTGIISEEVFLNKVLFYLWTDVFKDFDVSSELFKNKKANRSFRFTDFFEDTDALENFIANFNLDAEEVEAENGEEEKKANKRNIYKSLTVSFPDDTVIKEDSIFNSFRAALEKIGLDRVAEVAKTLPGRKGHPIIDAEQSQELLDANYSYEKVGDYYVLNNIKNKSYSAFLKRASEALSLNLTATLE